MRQVEMANVATEYKDYIQKTFGEMTDISVDDIINISVELFKEIKATDINNDYDDNDMLLFQYGTYDWGKGKDFEFDITRQFIRDEEDEPYQLSLTLFFDPIDCKSYNCWSIDFENLEKWVENIKETEGYKLTKDLKGKKMRIRFEQV
jgi:hypothetical protein